MFYRIALDKLIDWSRSSNRKPLILRGARQVGKTTLVEMFSKNFEEFISLNLENDREKKIFEESKNINELIEGIFFLKEKPRTKVKTLIFIDEIQNSSKAVAWLRYFYENAGEFYVIAAGSLLESLIDNQISFPVGRVSYLPIRPFTFIEFILALSEQQSHSILSSVPVPEYAHEKLMQLFRLYSLIGGMPEIVKNYAANRDVILLKPIYDALITSYKDDIEKYSRSRAQTQILRHVIDHIFFEAGSRITYQGFGNSNYKSREMKEAFYTFEKTFLLNLIFPVTTAQLPLIPNNRKSPKLQVVDSGLINFVAGVQIEFFNNLQLNDVYRGRIAEHITGQELTALNFTLTHGIHFWTREKNADAEVDFIYPFGNLAIPLEVKSGKAGKLRSLNEYMENANHNYAVRVYSDKLSISKTFTRTGKEFYLLNLPFYLVHQIDDYLHWFMERVK